MADKSVGELIAALSVTPTDLFVLEQNGTAKKLTGQVLENWLVSFADGHGGIHSIKKLSTSGLADTYHITLADTTTFDFVVTNGRGITGISKTSTSGLVDTYTISYNDGTTSKLTVTNGAKGDKGDNAYIWIKYASQKPTESSHSMGDIPDDWVGIYSGNSSTAPTDWNQYKWFKHKGEKGDTGESAKLTSSTVEYQVSDSGTIIPSGAWSSSVPVVAQGKYLWTRTTNNFNTGSPVVSYSVSRMGMDGSGSVSSVANISPDENGNVPLTAADIGALPNTGGDMTGELRMNGQPISGLNMPVANDQAANMGFVNHQVRKASPRNLLDNSDFTNPVNQRGFVSGSEVAAYNYFIDRWRSGQHNINPIIDSNGISNLTNESKEVQQFVDLSTYIGKTVTLVLYADTNGPTYFCSGIVSTSSDWIAIAASEKWECALTGQGLNIWAVQISVDCKYIALYEGEYTAETLPGYKSKGYGAELAECQRYYQIRSANNIAAVDMRPTMRLSSPTITSVTGGYAYSADL